MTSRARPTGRRLVVAAVALACFALSSAVSAHEAIERQIADLTARIVARPQDASLYLRRGELHRAHAEWEAAARDYHRARALAPDLDAVDLCLGRLHLDAGRPAPAVETLNRFLARHPDHLEALAARARASARLGRSLDAARDFTRAIALSAATPVPDLYIERARARAEAPAPRLEDALGGLDEGLARLGPIVGLELYAIEIETHLGRIDAALTRFDRLADLSPRKESFLVRRAGLLEAAARRADARRAYEEALGAIAILPPDRRSARTVRDLEAEARAGLTRLSVVDGTPPRGGREGPR